MLAQPPDRPSQAYVEELARGLSVEQWSLRERVAEALARMGPVAFAPLLRQLREGLWYARAAAAKALGRMDEPRALRPLLEGVWDQNRTVSEECLHSLVQACRRGRALAVAKIVHSRGPVARGEFLDKLRELQPDAAERLERILSEKALMGAEARLDEATEERIATTIRDADWGLAWDDFLPSRPLDLQGGTVLDRLREGPAGTSP
jgi:HEAT repeat protein